VIEVLARWLIGDRLEEAQDPHRNEREDRVRHALKRSEEAMARAVAIEMRARVYSRTEVVDEVDDA
jgi:hypothetical protein